ncbi:MAG: T9SS C-terminal target domain-containing protein [Bacteroidetes bacterium]|nr:MAG: T9SS C-terminal target domain-containing protein [Bacteroidota bacterium]
MIIYLPRPQRGRLKIKMKRILFLLGCFLSTIGFAQNFTFNNNGDTIQYGRLNLSYNFSATVENLTSSSKNYRAELINIQLPSTWEVSYCTPAACYPPGVTNTTFSLDGNSQGAITTEFHVGNTKGLGSVRLKVTDLSDNEVQYIDYYVEVKSFLGEFSDTLIFTGTNEFKRIFFDVYNNTSAAIEVKIFLTNVNIPQDWQTGIYTSSGTFSETDTAMITISSTNWELAGIDFNTGNTPDSGKVTVNLLNPLDSTLFTQEIIVHSSEVTSVNKQYSESVLVYPNPFTHQTTIKAPKQSEIRVFDSAGQLIEKGTFEFGSHYPPGVYIAEITIRQTVKTVKVVKK